MPLPTLGDIIPAIVARYCSAAAVGPVTKSRDAAPDLTFAVSGALTQTQAVSVQIVAGDILDPTTHAIVTPATVKTSLNGGATWSSTAPAPEGSTLALEPGLTVRFPAGIFEAGDRYDVEVFGAVTVTSIIGEQGIAESTTPPKLVWVPTRDTFGPPNVLGPHPQGRSVRTRRAGIDLHVWAAAVTPTPGIDQAAANLTAAERMLNDILYAIDQELRVGTAADGSIWWGHGCKYSLQSATWQTKGTLLQNGCECIAELVFDLPIAAPAPVSTRSSAFTLNKSITAGTP
jgi:hypothetical protein